MMVTLVLAATPGRDQIEIDYFFEQVPGKGDVIKLETSDGVVTYQIMTVHWIVGERGCSSARVYLTR